MIHVRLFGEQSAERSEPPDGADRVPILFSKQQRRLESLFLFLWASPELKEDRKVLRERIYGREHEAFKTFLSRALAAGPERTGRRSDRGVEALLRSLRRDGEFVAFDPSADVDVERFRRGDLVEKLRLYRDVLLPEREEPWAERLRAEQERRLLTAIERHQALGERLGPNEDVGRILKLYCSERISRSLNPAEESREDAWAKKLTLALARLAVASDPGGLEFCGALFRSHGHGENAEVYGEIVGGFDAAAKLAGIPPDEPPALEDRGSVARVRQEGKDGSSERTVRMLVETWSSWNRDTQAKVGLPWIARLLRKGGIPRIVEGEALLLYAAAEVDLRRFKSAHDVLLQIELMLPECGREPTSNGRPLAARYYVVESNCASEEGDTEEARRFLDEALELLSEEQHEQVARTLEINRASFHVDDGRPALAVAELRPLLDAELDDATRSSLLHNLGAACLDATESLRDARLWLGQAIKLRRRIGADYQALSKIDLARLDHFQGRYDQAEEGLHEAVALAESVEASFAHAYLLLSACAVARGEPEKCPERLRKALALSQSHHDPRRFANLAEQGAHYLIAVGRMEAAEGLLASADLIRSSLRRTPYDEWMRDLVQPRTVPSATAARGRMENLAEIDRIRRSLVEALRTA